MSDQYVLKKTDKSNIFEVVKFSEKDNSFVTYKVTKGHNYYRCDCPGFYRQKEKKEHKHSKLVQFWEDNLDSETGYTFWFDGPDIEYSRTSSCEEV
jgi:hypothetical protein